MSQQPAKEIFLSYGREVEIIYFVKRLKQDLEHNGFSVWLDSDNISSGGDWHGAIGTALDNCKALIPVISNKYIQSRFCKGELYTADGDKKLIFPVFVEDVDLSASEIARGVKFIVSGINWTYFRPNIEDYAISLSKLVEGMREKGLGQDVDSTDSGQVTAQLAGLHLSPNGQPSAPPPMHPAAGQVPVGMGYPPPPTSPYYHHYPSHSPSPQPYYTTSPTNLPYPPDPSVTPPHAQPPYSYPASTTTPPYHGVPAPAAGYYQPSPYQYQQPHPPTAPPYTPPTPPNSGGYYPGNPYQTTPPSGGGVDYTDSRPHPYGSEPPPPYILDSGQSGTTGVEKPSGVEKPVFKVGMKLEAVDQRFPYFVCVATVMDKNESGDELLVHFDGWGADYNYWCSRDAIELHPAGWCDKMGWELQKPQGQPWENWSVYLKETHSEKASIDLFNENQLANPGSLLFEPGMKLEARDRLNPTLFRAAAIKEVRLGEVKVEFDGLGGEFDYWCSSSSNDIHPCMWSGKQLQKGVKPPEGYVGVFRWNEYLARPNVRPAPAHLFTQAQLTNQATPSASDDEFQIGMRLEAKDRLNLSLVAVATIANIKDDQLLIHFDGWTSRYDYWCPPECVDIHPRGWCQKNHIKLNPPQNYGGNFDWDTYLAETGAVAAPEKLFTQEQAACQMVAPLPKSFQVGMKLEAKDRKTPNLICVASIIKMNNKGSLLIHFDGWTSTYDYWCTPDTEDIHPVGWCAKNGKALQAPYGHIGPFHWETYLSQSNAIAAPEELFTPEQAGCHVTTPAPKGFQVGMKLEAKDRKNPNLICVASIIKMNNKGSLLIHFDGWTSTYDYWCTPDTEDIHPVGWCDENEKVLQAPKDYSYGRTFDWDTYLSETNAIAAPDELFQAAQGGKKMPDFQAGMRLEAKDRKYPTMVCVATISEVDRGTGRLLIHFDGWGDGYDYWCEHTSTDIHPMEWCKQQKHKLEKPKGYSGDFTWKKYLKDHRLTAAPSNFFTTAQKS